MLFWYIAIKSFIQKWWISFQKILHASSLSHFLQIVAGSWRSKESRDFSLERYCIPESIQTGRESNWVLWPHHIATRAKIGFTSQDHDLRVEYRRCHTLGWSSWKANKMIKQEIRLVKGFPVSSRLCLSQNWYIFIFAIMGKFHCDFTGIISVQKYSAWKGRGSYFVQELFERHRGFTLICGHCNAVTQKKKSFWRIMMCLEPLLCL